MRLLLDTHVLIWSLSSPGRLPRRLVRRLEDPATVVFASAASTWEIAIKAALGKIDASPDEVAAGIRETGFTELSVSVAHTCRLADLPNHHRDPFDRMLVAQALEEGLTLVTSDRALHSYPIPMLWA